MSANTGIKLTIELQGPNISTKTDIHNTNLGMQ
jgi:hypothetical protein